MILQAGEHIGEPGQRINVVELGGFDQSIDSGGTAAALVGAGEGPVAATDGDAPHGPLGGIVAHAQAAVVEEANQRLPAVEAVGDRLAGLATGRYPVVLLA